jgi:ribosomal protein S18 acetylase RimI-like enzyme
VERDEPQIRPYRQSDLDDLYRICLLTGANGGDASHLFTDPMLLGHLHAAPYGCFEPELAFVAEDSAGVGGYVLGAADTQAFERRLEQDWWPELRRRYPPPPPGLAEQQRTRDQDAAYLIHHPFATPAELTGTYPAHLHINLVPRLQRRGLGRRLISTLVAALRVRGAAGLHLGVREANTRAIAFYRHLGFTDIPGYFSERGGVAFGMDLRSSTAAGRGAPDLPLPRLG